MPRSRFTGALAASGLGLLLLLPSDGFAQEAGDLRAEVASALGQHCVSCHNDRLQTADVVLDPNALARPGDQAELWERVLRQLRARTMPPPAIARPGEEFYEGAVAYLTEALDESAAARPNPGELPLAHRLTRTEYRNAIRDLLALPDLPAELDYETLLPADNSSSGFDNLADTLFVSPAAMESYLAAARKISRIAVGDPEMAPLVNIHVTPVRQPQDMRNEALPFGTRGGLAIDGYFPLDGEYEFMVQVAGTTREPHRLEISIDGVAMGEAVAATGPRVPGTEGLGPGQSRFRFAVPAGAHAVGITFFERSEALSEAPLRPPGRTRGELPAVESVTITGPFDVTGPGETDSRERIFVCRPSDATGESACADEILLTLMRRAYRRDVTTDDLDRVRGFYDQGREERDFDLGIQRALERMLVSPQFLFRIEAEPEGAQRGTVFPVDDFALASRLSFFLWSSIPDDALLDAASEGRLRQPGELGRQVDRMLADPRSESLITNFAAQWLYLGDVERKDPDLYLFRDFDEGLRAALVRETELFLDSILREDRSVLDLLTADYTFLNERLASHYGIPNITGGHFRRVTLPEGSPRAGLLGQGSILMLTSYATRTSPVLRGKYVLENLLATPPPPPPPDVPSLDTGSAGEPLSMKEAMELHRANPACAGCHARMDPIGFALENFDAVGRWRETYGGKPVDHTGALPDGTAVDGVDGVRELVLGDPDQFVEAMTHRLLMFATGRNVQYYDQPAIRSIARTSAVEGYTFASLVRGVVDTVAFQSRIVRSSSRTEGDQQ